MSRLICLSIFWLGTLLSGWAGVLLLPSPVIGSTVRADVTVDSVAERMLLYQRQNGGWPQPGGNKINYKLSLSASTRNALLADKAKRDATIDDGATTGEIEYLVAAFKQTGNPIYRQAAERGVTYLLSAQNVAGGWPQFYPDSSGYRKHITYNDNAMVGVLWLMKHIADGAPGFDALDQTLVPKAQRAVRRGIDCILRTQVMQNGRLTAWCAQHDSRTLKPAKARAFELPSLSGHETVGIVRFLMSEPNPTHRDRRRLVGVREIDRHRRSGHPRPEAAVGQGPDCGRRPGVDTLGAVL